MKRFFLVLFFIFSFLLFLRVVYATETCDPPLISDYCSTDSNCDEPNTCICSSGSKKVCSRTLPTATPRPATATPRPPTATPSPILHCLNTSPPKPTDCATRTSCTSGQCFPVCNYGSCASGSNICVWACTGDSITCTQEQCTSWTNWVCGVDGITETRACRAPSNCTNVAQAQQPCTFTTIQPTNPPSNPTNTPTPFPVVGVCDVSLYNCTAGTLGWWAEYPTVEWPNYYAWQWWCNGSNASHPGFGSGVGDVLCIVEKKIPNCTNLTGPSTITLGQSATYTADFFSPQGNLSGEINAGQNGSWVWDPAGNGVPISGNFGTRSFTWTPSQAGTYDVFGRAWDDALAECRGKASYVDGPPRFTCAGLCSMTVNVVAPTPTPTQAPSAWIKLKDSSFISTNSLTSKIPYVPAPFDSYDDDDQSPYFIIGSSGLVGAPVINLGLNASAKTGNPEWKATNLNTSYKMTPALFYSYIKARKEYKKINSLNEITADGIYYYQGTNPLTINSTPTEFNSFKIVLISPGTVNINSDLNGASLKSIAIIADTINFSSSTSQENGIFIANTITTGNNNILGLKINGNLIAQSVFTRERGWADLNRPSVFIVFKPNIYIDLLPYLSTANYEWRQLQ